MLTMLMVATTATAAAAKVTPKKIECCLPVLFMLTPCLNG
jgi:hypothetical protein